MLISETPSKCLIESVRQESPKRKTLVEFYHEDERIETKYEVASTEREQSSNVTNSESIVLCEECLSNGSIPIPIYIKTPALRTAEIREEVAWPREDVSTNSSPAFPISYELLDIRESYEIEENNREDKNMTPSPTTRVVIDRLSRETKYSAQSPELLEIRQGHEIEDHKQRQERNSSASSSVIDTFGFQPNSDVSDQLPSLALSEISNGFKMENDASNDYSWSQRLYQQVLDRSARLEAKRRKSKEDGKTSESTTLNKQCAFDSSTIWIPASRRRSKSSKDACLEVSLPKKKQMPSKVSTLQVFERLSECRKVSGKSSSRRQEPLLSKTRKQDSSQLTTSKACERLYRLGLARQRNRRSPPLKAHDDMSKETSATVASIASNYTGKGSGLVFDRLYNLSKRNRKKGNVEEESQSRNRSRRRPEGMAQGINNDCSSPVYNRLYKASKAKQVEGKR